MSALNKSHIVLPIMLGLLGAVHPLVSGGVGGTIWAAALGLGGLLVAWLLVNGLRANLAIAHQAGVEARSNEVIPVSGVAGFDTLCVQVLPIWGRHVESARSQTETAVSDLSMRFSEIYDHLGRALGTHRQQSEGSGNNGDSNVLAMLASGQHNLTHMLATLRAGLDAKKHMLNRIREVAKLSGHSPAVLEVFEVMGLGGWFGDPQVLPASALGLGRAAA